MKTSQFLRQAVAIAVQMCVFTALTSLYLAAAANPQPGPPPEPVTVRPATPAEERAWQREQLELLIAEASRARQ